MKNIVILISGSGSNMAAIVRTAQRDNWRKLFGAQVAAVISNRPTRRAWRWRASKALPPRWWTTSALPPARPLTPRWPRVIDRRQPALVVLAGFMRILTPGLWRATRGGWSTSIRRCCRLCRPHTHQRAIDAGCKVAGATVHRVTAELDHGPSWPRPWCRCCRATPPPALAERVLTQEHLIYPHAIANLLLLALTQYWRGLGPIIRGQNAAAARRRSPLLR
jgi:phosphoribosylglycinamide formyltransferase-1